LLSTGEVMRLLDIGGRKHLEGDIIGSENS
jgi:hypothetical protein